MHILFVHQNFPAQFGHIAAHLVKSLGWRATFATEREAGVEDGIEKIQYTPRAGATKHHSFYTRGFESQVAHAEAVYRAVKARPDIKPDLVVAHSGFGSSVFLREALSCPIVNFFEYFYRPHNSDMDFRPDMPVNEKKFLRSRVRNAMILLDLENCDAGYTPTRFQHGTLPTAYRPKVRTIFDGVDTTVYYRRPNVPRVFAGRTIGPNTKIVTYCARGFEKMRGFDKFMQAARIIYREHPDVVFLVAGTDKIHYGGDEEQLGGKSLRQHIVGRDKYDLSKFIFLGWISRESLAEMLSVGDAHIYLTVPFVLSWSMMNALSCGAVVVGSRTAPVEEMIVPGETGLLADFFSPEEIAARTLEVLREPARFEGIRENAMAMIREKYSLKAVLPQMLELYEDVIAGKTRSAAPATNISKPASSKPGWSIEAINPR